nr:LuxR family transcriptional regulator [Kitasatospora sp.]
MPPPSASGTLRRTAVTSRNGRASSSGHRLSHQVGRTYRFTTAAPVVTEGPTASPARWFTSSPARSDEGLLPHPPAGYHESHAMEQP